MIFAEILYQGNVNKHNITSVTQISLLSIVSEIWSRAQTNKHITRTISFCFPYNPNSLVCIAHWCVLMIFCLFIFLLFMFMRKCIYNFTLMGLLGWDVRQVNFCHHSYSLNYHWVRQKQSKTYQCAIVKHIIINIIAVGHVGACRRMFGYQL